MTELICFSRDMGLDRRDFFRILPTAIGDSSFSNDGNRVIIEPIADSGSLTITLGAEQTRRLSALMVLPRMQVDFAFSGVSQSQVDAFMDTFDIYYRRGGG